FRGRPLAELAVRVLDIAAAGLKARARRDGAGADESGYLDVLRADAAAGRNPATAMLERFHGAWGGSVDPAFKEYAY
ncbi:MAG TPA: glutamate--cysteine ligase, partial [Alphaproteobacteria bacterium]|nr:glutamate--cysteine ligase [Alphaproteobacteria bacterium]